MRPSPTIKTAVSPGKPGSLPSPKSFSPPKAAPDLAHSPLFNRSKTASEKSDVSQSPATPSVTKQPSKVSLDHQDTQDMLLKLKEAMECIKKSDDELARLKASHSELEQQLAEKDKVIEDLQQQLKEWRTSSTSQASAPTSLESEKSNLESKEPSLESKKPNLSLPTQGATLTHMTRHRIAPKQRRIKTTEQEEESSLKEDPVNKDNPLESPSITVTPDHPDPPLDTGTEFKRKMSAMGGVNPLVGMIPLSLKDLKSSRVGKSQDLVTLTIDTFQLDKDQQEHVLKWFSENVGETDTRALVEKLETQAHSTLKDGQLLCRLLHTLKPALSIKINTGKFAFMHMENINQFLKMASQLGVQPQHLFQANDLYDGDHLDKVWICLYYLMKL